MDMMILCVDHTPFSLMDHALIIPPKVFARAILPPLFSEHVAALIVVISLLITFSVHVVNE